MLLTIVMEKTIGAYSYKHTNHPLEQYDSFLYNAKVGIRLIFE